MRLKELADQYKGNVFDELSNEPLRKETDGWTYYSSIPLNGIIAIGWLSNDDVLIINGDGIFIYDILQKEVVFRDYESSFQESISNDNLNFHIPKRAETVNIFGLRGGGGNLLTKDNLWNLERVDIAWNIKVPRLTNYRTREAFFLELPQNGYEGNIYLGFSQSENYFAIMGDGGVDIYKKMILIT